MKPFTQAADVLDKELAVKIDGIIATHNGDATQLVGILLDVEAATSSPSIPPCMTSPGPSLPWRCATPPPAG